MTSTSRSVVWKLFAEEIGRGEGDEVCRRAKENPWMTGFELGSEHVICSCLAIFTEAR